MVVVTHGGIIHIALTQVPKAPQAELEFEPDGSVKVLSTWKPLKT